MNLEQTYKRIAAAALADGLSCDISPTGPLTAWIHQHVSYRKGTLSFIVFSIACELADLKAQREGYANACDKAFQFAAAKVGTTPHSTTTES